MLRPYVLVRNDAREPSRVVELFADGFDIQAYAEPRGFGHAIGPFHTRFAAELMADFGEGNPHMQHVEDCEQFAKKYLSLAEDAIENETEDAFDVASDCGQMFANVRHMTWFKERIAYQLLCDASA